MDNKNDNIIAPVAYTPVTGKTDIPKTRLRLGLVLTLFLLVISLILVWFLLTAKSVYIETDPDNALVDIQNGMSVKLAGRYLIRSGDYRLTITAQGYHTVDQSINISKVQNQRYSFQLQRLPGHLKLSSTPVADAEIWIDNTLKGKTPAIIRDIEHGSHEVRIVAERYLPFVKTIKIEGLDHEQALDIKLTPAWADVTLSSSPEGATLYIDGTPVGETPLKTEISQGAHDIRLELPLYAGWSKKIKVTANEAMTIPEVILKLAESIINVKTQPSKANVIVDGVYKGQTPIALALIPGERITIDFFKEGYQQASRKIKPKLGKNQNLLVDLEAELTEVEIASIPADAEIYIDNILRGKTNQTIPLSTIPHQIEIRKQGYLSYKTTITPRPGIPQQIKVTLKTLRQVKLESIKPIIKSASGQRLKLFRPSSSFTMGASRREPGRRANETLRNVKLTRAFYVSLTEVTNTQYAIFDKKHSSGIVQGNSLSGKNKPVVQITWVQAAQYCNWLSKQASLSPFYMIKAYKLSGIDLAATGYRLPTETEWAWLARVQRKGQLLKFPWGDKLPPTSKSGNYADETASSMLSRIIKNYKDGYIVTAPVGSFQANEKGLFDLGGNVAEWVNDYYDIAIGQNKIELIDPLGPKSGEFHVIRGSSWAHGTMTELRLSYRDYAPDGRDDVGFRIARYLE